MTVRFPVTPRQLAGPVNRFAADVAASQEDAGEGLVFSPAGMWAMLAGLSIADADVIVTMDADLQDDIGAVAAMIAAHRFGLLPAMAMAGAAAAESRRPLASMLARGMSPVHGPSFFGFITVRPSVSMNSVWVIAGT